MFQNPMQIMQLFGQLKNNQNPMGMLQNMFGNNPMLNTAMKMAQGKDPEQLHMIVENLCKQRGIDFSQMQQLMGQFGIKL